MKAFYDDGKGIVIYHGDCRQILPELRKSDLVLTDPPYGIKLKTNNTRFTGGHCAKLRDRGIGSSMGKPIKGDDKQMDPTFLTLAGDDQIIWGLNHFSRALLPAAALVWLKRNDAAFGSFLSDAELAYMSKGHGVYCWKDLSNNSITKKRVHPTQKPVSLIGWCLSFFPNAKTVIDPYMGSGTTLVASKALGRCAIGIEIEECYCETAALRLSQEVLTLSP